jgi:hypothetical protein
VNSTNESQSKKDEYSRYVDRPFNSIDGRRDSANQESNKEWRVKKDIDWRARISFSSGKIERSAA